MEGNGHAADGGTTGDGGATRHGGTTVDGPHAGVRSFYSHRIGSPVGRGERTEWRRGVWTGRTLSVLYLVGVKMLRGLGASRRALEAGRPGASCVIKRSIIVGLS
jgi:hypothetical protein